MQRDCVFKLQNVVGVDIAELLLVNKKNYPYNVNRGNHEPIRRESTISQRSGGTGGDASVHEGSPGQEVVETVKQRKTVEQMTDEFRNTLLYGLVQEALGKSCLNFSAPTLRYSHTEFPF